MLRIHEIKLPLDHSTDDLLHAISTILQTPQRDLVHWEIRRQAIDARKKNNILLVYTVDVSVTQEDQFLKRGFDRRVIPAPDESYLPVKPGYETLNHRPAIVGSGPAGLFAGLILAQAGYRPIILERGKAVEERCLDVACFWRDGALDPESNAQFGEGGAGTFSDGKLNTLINDPRCRKVLEELSAAGAPRNILVSNKPHIGTDRLRTCVRAMRDSIIRQGGDIRFSCKVTGLRFGNNALRGLEINTGDILECEATVFAIGHSARDTFSMLQEHGLHMIPKPFSIGMRIEHPQQLIDKAQFGRFAGHPRIGAAEYKMVYHAPHGRSAYTFCMCPGGEVIAAASAPGCVVTNGMSFFARDGQNANAALLVDVGPEDFPDAQPLSGFAFQTAWENRAFTLGGKKFLAPVQLLSDFLAHRPSNKLGQVQPTYRPGVMPSDLHECLPGFVCDTVKQAIPAFTRQLRGFNLPDAVLTGVETRSSCPVRLIRNKNFQGSINGIYPAGEGAGYAGGIMSAAVDGIRVAEAIIERFSTPSG